MFLIFSDFPKNFCWLFSIWSSPAERSLQLWTAFVWDCFKFGFNGPLRWCCNTENKKRFSFTIEKYFLRNLQRYFAEIWVVASLQLGGRALSDCSSSGGSLKRRTPSCDRRRRQNCLKVYRQKENRYCYKFWLLSTAVLKSTAILRSQNLS